MTIPVSSRSRYTAVYRSSKNTARRRKYIASIDDIVTARIRRGGLTENAGHEIAGHENTGHEFARHDNYRMKIDHITLECVFLLNFKTLVCEASVLTYKKT